MNSVCIVDPICKKNEHYIFNLSLLCYLKEIDSENKVFFFCYKSNNEIIEDCSRLNVNVFKIKDVNSYSRRVTKFFFKVFVSVKILFAKRIVLLAIDNTILPALFLLNIFLLPFLFKKMVIVSHNNLYTIKTNKIKRFVFKLFLSLYQPKILFLSPNFAEEFKKETNYNRSFGLFHQNYRDLIEVYKNIKLHKKQFLNDTPRMKSILVAKSYTLPFLNLYNKLYAEGINLGSKKIIIKYVSNKKINFKENNSIIFERIDIPEDITKYFENITKSDFVFLPEDYIANHRASGVLMDALSLKTNFIAPNVGHFKDLVSEFGIGNLYNDEREFLNILSKIVDNDIKSEIEEDKFQTLIKQTSPDLIGNFLFHA